MRQTVLACWGVVAALVVAVEGKPYNPYNPYTPQVFDISAAYENYHQLWMSEARRNAVAPLSISQQIARSLPGRQSAVTKVAPSAPVAEKPPQEQLIAASNTEKAVVDQKTQDPQQPQEPSATEQRNDNQMTADQQAPETATEVQTEDTMTVEPTTTEVSVQEEVTTEMQTQEQTTPQNIVDLRSPSKQAAPQLKAVTPTARPATVMTAAFDNFFNRWNTERLRNSIRPVATPIPPLSASYYNTKQTRLTRPPLASNTVDPPAKAPAKAPTPTPETSVDTLTQKAAPSAPVATAAASPSTDTVNLIKSLAQNGNWNKQGSAPLIIILQQPGAAVPTLA